MITILRSVVTSTAAASSPTTATSTAVIASASSLATTLASSPIPRRALLVLIQVAGAEIVAKVDSFIIEKFLRLLLLLLDWALGRLAILWLIALEAEKRVCIYITSHSVPCMCNIQMCL